MAQAPSDDRQIERGEETRHRIFGLAPQAPAAHQQQHQERHDRDREHRGEPDREGLGPGQRAEHAALLRFEQEHRQERDHDDKQRVEDRTADLARRVEQRAAAFGLGHRPAAAAAARWRWPFSTITIDASTSTPIASAKPPSDMILELIPQQVHRDKARQQRERNSQNWNQRRAEVKQEDDYYDTDDCRFFDQVALESVDRTFDQPGAIVTRHDLDARRAGLERSRRACA